MENSKNKPTAFNFNKGEVEKLAKIGRAAEILAEAAKLNNVTIDELLPLVTALAKKKILN